MIRLIKLQCPNCGAALEVDSSLMTCFCQYCGTKILLHNENEYVIHKIDEAELAKEHNERYRLELQAKEQEHKFELQKEASLRQSRRAPLKLSIWSTILFAMFFLACMDEPERHRFAIIPFIQIASIWTGYCMRSEVIPNKKGLGILMYALAYALIFVFIALIPK